MKKNTTPIIMKMIAITLLIHLTISLTGCASNPLEQTPEQKRAEIFFQQGTQELINKNYTEALRHLLEAKELAPNDDQIRNNLGMAYYLKKQIEKARSEFEKSLSINPKNSDARNNYASLLFELKKYDLAKKEYEKVLTDLTYTKNFRIFYNLGLIYSQLNQIEEARDMFQKSIAENSEYCPAKYQFAKLYVDEYKFKDALAALTEATKGTCVNEPALHFETGKVLSYLQRRNEAEIKYREILEKFSKTNFNTLAKEELSKIEDEKKTEAKLNNSIRYKQNETQDASIETPKF